MTDAASPQPQVLPPVRAAALVYGNAFGSGFVVMALEILSSRYLAPYFGGDIYTWSALIATALVALASGYLAGGRVADRWPTAAVCGGLLAVAEAWLVVMPLAADTVLGAVFAGTPDLRVGAIAGALALLYVPFALMGMYAPYAVRLLLRETAASGTVSGRVYAISTVGGILGIGVTVFALIPHVGTQRITVVLGSIVLAGGALLAVQGRRSRAGDGLFTGAVIATVAAAGGMAWAAAAPRAAVSPEVPDVQAVAALPDGLVERRESPYQRIAVYKLGQQLVMAVRARGSDQIQSLGLIGRPEVLLAPYTRMLTGALAYPERPRRVLVLGVGGGTVVTYLAAHVPGLEIDAVEIDPVMAEFADRYFGLRPGGGTRVFVQDARAFLRTHQARYDAVLLDVFHGDRIPFHLLTAEFLELVRERLTPDGVLAVNLLDRSRLPAAALRTLRAVFPHADGYAAEGQTVVMAYGAPERPAALLRERAERLQRRHGFPHALPALLERRTPLNIEPAARVLRDDHAPVEWLQAQGP